MKICGTWIAAKNLITYSYKGETLEKLLTIKEFAEAVRLSERTIQRHIQMGDIEALYYNDRQPVRIPESEIRPFINKVYTRYKDGNIVKDAEQ